MNGQKIHNEQPAILEPSSNRVQALLMEYRMAHSNADHMEQVIWNTAAILVTGSITGLALLGNTLPENPNTYDFVLRITVGVLSILLIHWWRKITSVWYFIQDMLYFRIVEIEEELDLYSESYISYLDRMFKGEDFPSRPRVSRMITAMKDHYKPLRVSKIVNNIGLVLMFIWCIFLLVQISVLVGWI